MLEISLKQLEAFVCVADCGSFYEAAQRLYVTQPTVSSHIAALEAHFHTTLLTRGSRKKVTLTESGQEIYRRAGAILESCRALEQTDFTSFDELRIGASTVPMGYILPPILAAFRKQEPGCRFTLEKGDSGDVYRMLEEGRIQLGVVGTLPEREGVAWRRLCGDELVLVAPPTAELRALKQRGTPGRALLNRPLIVRGAGSGTQKMAERYFTAQGIDRQTLSVVARVESNEAALALTEQGVGCAILSSRAAKAWEESGRVLCFRMDAQPLTRELYLVWQKKKGLSRPAERFAALAVAYMAEG